MQLLDLPGIIEGAKDGKGRGRQVFFFSSFLSLFFGFIGSPQVIAVARTCDLILIVVDSMNNIRHKGLPFFLSLSFPLSSLLNSLPSALIEYELEGFGIRLNKKPPPISLKKKEKGGITFTHTVPLTHCDKFLVTSVMSEYKIHSADICFRGDCTIDELIDVIEGNRIYTPCVYVLNKIDQITMEELDVFTKLPHHVMISAYKVYIWEGRRFIEGKS